MAGDNKQSNAGGGSSIRMEPAKSRNRSKRQSRITAASSGIAVGFVNFIRGHAVVSLAVGFVIATQAQAIIKQLVTSFITPTFQFFFKGNLVNDRVVYHISGRTVIYTWGAFVSDLLDFIFVLAALYLIIRFFKLDKLDRKESDS